MKRNRTFLFIGISLVVLGVLTGILLFYNQDKNDTEENGNDYYEHTIVRENLISVINAEGIALPGKSYVYKIQKSKDYSVSVEPGEFIESNSILYIEADSEIKSPCYGFIESIEENDEEITITLFDMSTMKATLYIPIEESYDLKKDNTLTFIFNNYNVRYPGVIDSIDFRYTDIGGNLYLKVEASLTNRIDHLLLVNSPIYATIETGRINNVLVIPEEYIEDLRQTEDGLVGMVNVKQADSITKTSVFLGIKSNGRYQILKGLSENDVVVLR